MKILLPLGILVVQILTFFQVSFVLGNIDANRPKDLTIRNVALLWKLSTTSVPYLDLYVGLNEINVTLHVVMFETSKRPVLEGNEVITNY